MNHKLWSDAGARVIAAMFLVAGLAACGEHLSNVSARTPKATPADASAVVIGTAPAQPSGDPPGTTPVAPGTSDLSKETESKSKPQEGDDSSHMSASPNSSQKSGDSDQQPPRTRQ
jgi:hypothetical protein